jgi:arabinofuranosyltransferase
LNRVGLRGREKVLLDVFLAAFAALVIRNAWLSDDAYITFRTVDNFINGYGLTWNVAERVQTYTHPLWMFLLSVAYFFTREIFFTSLILSIVLSLVAAGIVAFRASRSVWLGCAGLAVLTLSKASIDYATSGLENPLAHLLLVVFLLVYLDTESSPACLPSRESSRSVYRLPDGGKKLFWLAFLASLGMVNRADMLLLYAPVVLYALIKARSVKAVGVVALGFLPFVLWELFSLFYYGFPFPNTAYAKLTSALISRQDLMIEGLHYLHNSLRADTITLLVTGLALLVPFLTREWRKLPVVAGMALYLLYVVYIGGDFMSGRFFTVTLFAAVVLLVSSPKLAEKETVQAIVLAGVVLVGLSASFSPVRASGEIGARTGMEPGWLHGRSITDERANYYRNTGLLRAFQQSSPLPDHDWALEGRAARKSAPAVVEKGSVGFYGYFAGPEIYVVDLLGLGNPLLARLPPADPDWRIGHFGRLMPDGYRETLETGENRIVDRNLALYYDKLALIIRGDLFDGDRLHAIWQINVGAYDGYLDAYAYFRGATFTPQFSVTNLTERPYVLAYVWNNNAGETYLLDDASSRGDSYTVAWRITRDGVQFDGPSVQKISSIGPLSDAETLNVGVLFSPTPDLATQDVYEYRFWLRFEDDGQLTVILPGKGFHNAEALQGYWFHEDIGSVMCVIP